MAWSSLEWLAAGGSFELGRGLGSQRAGVLEWTQESIWEITVKKMLWRITISARVFPVNR
jgi:hypothetical protein